MHVLCNYKTYINQHFTYELVLPLIDSFSAYELDKVHRALAKFIRVESHIPIAIAIAIAIHPNTLTAHSHPIIGIPHCAAHLTIVGYSYSQSQQMLIPAVDVSADL